MTLRRASRRRTPIRWTATVVVALLGCVVLGGFARVDDVASARGASEITSWAPKPASMARHAAPTVPRPIAIPAIAAGAAFVLVAWGLASIAHDRAGFGRGAPWFRRRGPPVPA